MSGEKTEQPTAKRLADARRRGEVPRSRELVAFATLLGAYAAATFSAEATVGRLGALVVRSIRIAARPERPHLAARVTGDALGVFASALTPVLLAALVVGVATARLDAGSVFAPSRVLPKLSRIDPASGARQLFSRERYVELAKALVVLAVIGYVVVTTATEVAPSLPHLVRSTGGRGLTTLGEVIGTIVARVLVALAAIAAVDVFVSRREFSRSQRMTKHEVTREYKDSEGDPHHKGERARMHREIVEHSVLEGVRRADVLVVNPTHLAIALRFDVDGEQNAPEVVAKGEDELAKKMIEAAREAGVPVMRDIPLARSLYDLDLGDEIPEPLFEAVAAVLRAAWAEREAGS